MEYWIDGIMEYWIIGIMEYWSNGIMEFCPAWEAAGCRKKRSRKALHSEPQSPTKNHRERQVGLHLNTTTTRQVGRGCCFGGRFLSMG